MKHSDTFVATLGWTRSKAIPTIKLPVLRGDWVLDDLALQPGDLVKVVVTRIRKGSK